MRILKEFRDFAMRGNVVDMAVGVIIGAAFGKIVSSLVSDVLMPPIGKLLGNMNFSNLFVNLEPSKEVATLEEARKAGVAVVGYGAFITTIIDFLIVALCIFFIVKVMNTLREMQTKGELTPPSTKECPLCCSTISVKAKRCPQCTADIPAA